MIAIRQCPNGIEMIRQDDGSINSTWVSRHHRAKDLPESINVVSVTEDASPILGDEREKKCRRVNFCPPVPQNSFLADHGKGIDFGDCFGY